PSNQGRPREFKVHFLVLYWDVGGRWVGCYCHADAGRSGSGRAPRRETHSPRGMLRRMWRAVDVLLGVYRALVWKLLSSPSRRPLTGSSPLTCSISSLFPEGFAR